MKNRWMIAAVLLMLSAGTAAHAQLNLKGLKEKAQKAVEKAVSGNTSSSSAGSSSSSSAVSGALDKVASSIPAGKGKTYYVSATTGSARADPVVALT